MVPEAKNEPNRFGSIRFGSVRFDSYRSEMEVVQDCAHLPIGSFESTSEGKVVGRKANDGKVAGTHMDDGN